MKMKFLIAWIIALTIMATAINTHALSAKWLKSSCEGEAGRSLCYGYIAAVTDTIAITNEKEMKKTGKPFICPPSNNITYGQYINIVLNYIILNPDVLDDNAAEIVLIALLVAFPCAH